jgi:hypothetical protein
MVIQSTPELLDELAAMGIDLYATASNHSYDFGRRGMASTMRALEERNLAYAGLGRDLPSVRSPSYVTTPAGRVGLVTACTSVAPGSKAGSPSSLLPGRPGISPLHVNWTYRLRNDRLEQLRAIGEATGIDDAKATWIARDDSTGAAEGHYEFMHMTFESVNGKDEEGIALAPYDPDREAVLARVREADMTADWIVASLHAHQGPSGMRMSPRRRRSSKRSPETASTPARTHSSAPGRTSSAGSRCTRANRSSTHWGTSSVNSRRSTDSPPRASTTTTSTTIGTPGRCSTRVTTLTTNRPATSHTRRTGGRSCRRASSAPTAMWSGSNSSHVRSGASTLAPAAAPRTGRPARKPRRSSTILKTSPSGSEWSSDVRGPRGRRSRVAATASYRHSVLGIDRTPRMASQQSGAFGSTLDRLSTFVRDLDYDGIPEEVRRVEELRVESAYVRGTP